MRTARLYSSGIASSQQVVEALFDDYTNISGGPLSKGLLVYKGGLADYNTFDNANVLGLLVQDLANGITGKVQRQEEVDPTILTASSFIEGVLPDNSKTWEIWLNINGKMSVTPPTIASGKWKVFIGNFTNGILVMEPDIVGKA